MGSNGDLQPECEGFNPGVSPRPCGFIYGLGDPAPSATDASIIHRVLPRDRVCYWNGGGAWAGILGGIWVLGPIIGAGLGFSGVNAVKRGALAVSIVCLDQVTKLVAQISLIVFVEKPVIPGVLSFQLVYNPGAAFGILAHHTGLLITMSCMMVGFLLIADRVLVRSKWSRWGVACIMGGTVGNLIDRIWHGMVVDFINIHLIPVFNCADMAINIGVVLFMIEWIVLRRNLNG